MKPERVDNHAPGRVLVVLKDDQPDDAAVRDAVKTHGGSSRQLTHRAHAIDLPPGKDEQVVLSILQQDQRFAAVELDQKISPTFIPNDPYYSGYQWHLKKINCPTAWDTAVTRGAGVTIAICDSGAQPNHPDLIKQLVPGWNVLLHNTDTHDITGHGTNVAGTAAATGNNGWGVCGVSFASSLMPVVICDSTGYGYWSNCAAGITWAVNHGARVANLSYDGPSASAVIQSAGSYMMSKNNGLLVVSAGNDSKDPGYAPTTTMLVAAATDQNDVACTFSNYGAFVDLCAPGTSIVCTGVNSQIYRCGGTSFSAPIVAGVIAMMIAVKPTLTASQLRSLLLSTCVDLGAAGKDPKYGAGRVDAAAAVAAAAKA